LKNRHDHAEWMPSKSLMILAIVLSLAILTACAKNVRTEPVPCPLYPELLVLDPELAAATPLAVKALVVQNYLLLDDYAQKLEVRAGCSP